LYKLLFFLITAWGTDSETCPGGIFDLPIESTSIPEFPNDYVGGTYRDIGSGCSHSTIDRDFRPGIDDGKAEGFSEIHSHMLYMHYRDYSVKHLSG